MTTYLSVEFRDKDRAKALGARWDGTARQWYVPADKDLAPFAEWLPVAIGVQADTDTPTSTLPVTADKGITLTALLNQIGRAVEAAIPRAVWVRAELSEVNGRTGHYYLDLVERDETTGKQLAKTRAMIWSAQAQPLISKFCQATGVDFAPGIKVLLAVQPQFSAQYGLSLVVTDIDPSFTLGDMAAKLKAIRDQLRAEGIIDANKRYPKPTDFFRVAVIAPDGAAGLGDFVAEAQRLVDFGICSFQIIGATFQGDRALPTLLDALQQAFAEHAIEPFDAVVIIRGGGAVADLHWLNELPLARLICQAPMPIYTGIGHEKDSTVLDEAANQSFGTPSKLILFLQQTILHAANTALDNFQCSAGKALDMVRLAEARSAELLQQAIAGADRQLQAADHAMATAHTSIQRDAASLLQRAETEAHRQLDTINQSAVAGANAAQQRVETLVAGIQTAAGTLIQRAEEKTAEHWQSTKQLAAQQLDRGETEYRRLMTEVLALGPQATLNRGFAVAKAGGKPITTAEEARRQKTLEIEFKDGTVAVQTVN
jgi:exodeoxyribonuclease VII large subunit